MNAAEIFPIMGWQLQNSRAIDSEQFHEYMQLYIDQGLDINANRGLYLKFVDEYVPWANQVDGLTYLEDVDTPVDLLFQGRFGGKPQYIKSPLDWSLRVGNLELTEYLLERARFINLKCPQDQTFIYRAFRKYQDRIRGEQFLMSFLKKGGRKCKSTPTDETWKDIWKRPTNLLAIFLEDKHGQWSKIAPGAKKDILKHLRGFLDQDTWYSVDNINSYY
jgi:hypothetical protein